MSEPSDAEVAVRDLLMALGHDVTREGLRGTPRRVARFLHAFCHPEAFKFTTFCSEGMSEMIVQSSIPFASLCEHHLLPFVGEAAVGYLPGDTIVGLSKLARCVRFHASGLQNQERITRAVAEQLEKETGALGVGVILRARHTCMEIRGVCAVGAITTTSCLRGALLDDDKARAEFLRLARPRVE